MKGIFLGCTNFSEELLKFILSDINEFQLQAIFSIPEYFNISYSDVPVLNSNYSNLERYSKDLDIPFIEIDSQTGRKIHDYSSLIEELNPDVILVLGWYYMVPKKIRQLAKLGAWGIHASLLPKYAGGAPLVWAMINGEKKTGVSLFKLSDGVDDGDIIEQKSFDIDKDDTIHNVYSKSIAASKDILNNALNCPEKIVFKKQDNSKIEIYPQRRPEDGEIDLGWDGQKIYNFIRAQSYPYPGAFIKTVDGKRLIIEKARIVEDK